jgi:hypothetical protein
LGVQRLLLLLFLLLLLDWPKWIAGLLLLLVVNE